MDRRTFLMGTSLGALSFSAGCRNHTENHGHACDFHEIERLDLSDEELRQEVAHSPSQDPNHVIDKVKNIIELVHGKKLPKYFPNWIAFHAVLMYPDSYAEYRSGRNADENIKRIYETILNSDAKKNGPFVLRGGLPYPRHSGPYFMQEHHPDQFLHYFSMGGGRLDAPLKVDEQDFTMEDVLKRSMLEARTSNELAYTVLVYTKFLESDREWQNKFGETVSLPILLAKLLTTPERTCLGTHRLSALARAYAKKEFKEDKAIGKLWPELERQVFEALVRLKRSQRPDGGFEPPGITPGSQTLEHIDVYYTGHSLEWITFLEGDFCRDDWIVRAFERLVETVNMSYVQTVQNMDNIENQRDYFSFDGLCHTLSAMNKF